MTNKYLKISLFSMLLSSFAFGQNFDGPKKGSAIGFSANLVDFSASLLKVGKVDPGFSVMYWKGLTNKLDFSVRYNGLFSDYTQNPGIESSGGYVNEFEGALHLRALNDDHLFNPFLTAGIGIGNYGKKAWAPYSPLGIGLQMNMYGEGYLFLQANYRVSFTDTKLDNNMFYSLGFTIPLSHSQPKVEPVPLPIVVPVTDRDHDGVPDSTDACPDVAGLVSLQGCPDKDGDGIADKDDKCPDVAGIAKYNGCPIPDTDGDGINDEEDKCPTVAGVAKYNGCPIPDTDGDGVNDEEDRCPNLAGTVANHGCPEVKEEVRKRIDIAAKSIYFVTGSSKLLTKSNKSLDEVAKILEGDQNLKLDINGHTDNTGKAESNLVLSQKRAQAVYDYLVKKGVDQSRVKSEGFGQDQPIADNKTAAGRAKNRRVELKLHYD